jgi:hypothetical protein
MEYGIEKDLARIYLMNLGDTLGWKTTYNNSSRDKKRKT